MNEISGQVRRHFKKAREQTERTLHNLSEIKRETAKELKDVENETDPILREKRHPKILMISVGGNEYVSIRRVDGARLKAEFKIPDDVEGTEMAMLIPSSFLPDDGMIGIVGITQTYNAAPKDKEEIEFINEKTDFDDDDGWSHFCKLQHFLLGGGKYKKEKWDFSESPVDVRAVKRVGDRFFLQADQMVIEIKPNEEGDLEIPYWGYYWAEEEIEIQKELNGKFGIFYAVVKGSSEKEEKRLESPVKQELSMQTASD